MKIYFDMDGTIANLYKNNWLELLQAGNPLPYKVADRLIKEEILQELINQGFELGIVSWLAKNSTKEYDKQVRQAKKDWLKENYPNINFVEIHIVKYGTPKYQVVKEKQGILIDDEIQNRKNWKGLAIDPKYIEMLFR